MKKVVILFAEKYGTYSNYSDVDIYDITRDAKTYQGPDIVIAHPPCERWGRYWSGGPNRKTDRWKGDDDGRFAFALWAVRTFGGVVEHPEASHAWRWFGLPRPKQSGGWTDNDSFGGRSCCVAQGRYHHPAQKLTWLYGVEIRYLKLNWGRAPNRQRLELGPRSKEHAKYLRATQPPIKRLSRDERIATPHRFARCLLRLCR